MSDSFMQGNDDHSTAVPFSDDEVKKEEKAAEFEEDDAPTDSPEVRASRRQRRTERITRLLSDGKSSAARVKELEERDQKRERELAELRGMVHATAQMNRPANDNVDPYEQHLAEVYGRQTEAYNAAQAEIKAGTFTADRQKHWEGVAQRIESDKMRIHTERAIRQHIPQQRAESAQQVWVQKYPEVYQNPKAFQFAKATWERRLALGEQTTNSLVDEVMGETMTQFKLGSKPAPSASEKNRLSGVPSSGGGGSSRGSGTPAMNPQLRSMALARYGSEMSEEDAIKKWQAGIGKRLRDRKVI